DDMGGTLMEETISRMAGSENGSARTVAELTAIATAAGRPVRQRTTTYAGEPSTPAPSGHVSGRRSWSARTQVAWKPSGTRWGSSTRATGPAAMSEAS